MRIKETIIVEGKYDKIRLSQIVDANIICTDGFMISLLKRLADENGVIILTDSDSAGFKIRNYIKSRLMGKNVKHAFIPSVEGKEKRKIKPGKEGLLGVEGIRNDALIKALSLAGFEKKEYNKEIITKADFFKLGLSGGNNSQIKREKLADFLELPRRISANMLLDVINALYDKDAFYSLIGHVEF